MSDNKDNKKNNRKSIYHVTYIFIALFVLVIANYIYFLVFKSNDFINNTYNQRHEVLTERVIRGNILSADRSYLARTLIKDFGKEKRIYPYDDLFVHLVGRTQEGRAGLEETENIRMLTSDINPLERMYNELIGQKNPGNNVVTTLDVQLQKVAYDALGDKRGAVVVMEPSTGKVLAMVSKPGYNPNDARLLWPEIREDKDNESPLMNRATQGLYPPGSTFKLVTALAYIRDNPDYLNYEYDCKGSIEHDGMIVNCYNRNAHGKVDLITSFAKSCNTSFANMGIKLDMDHLYNISESLLFNQKLPLTMAYRPSSFQLKSGSGSTKEAMHTAIGQGRTLISPLHNAMIVSTVANSGVMMKPYVVEQIESADGRVVKYYEPQPIANPMTEEEAAYLSLLMEEVVEEGTGRKLKDLKVSVAGKTGSAEVEGKKDHAWFIGYAPADNPQIAFSIIVENVGSSSQYAVPIAEKLVDAYFE